MPISKVKCKICNKEIEGFNLEHAEYLMMQHNLVHRLEEKRRLKKDGELKIHNKQQDKMDDN